jgi:hypothetical protein
MKVFFSWSGKVSGEIAGIFNEWLPQVIQSIEIFYSPDDIYKGTSWFGEIAQTLNDNSVGILFMTRENLESPWIMFEAGALFKKLGEARVSPLLFEGLVPADIKGPLANINMTQFNKDDVFKLIRQLKGLVSPSLKDHILLKAFNTYWPELEGRITQLPRSTSIPQVIKTPEDQRLDEILEAIRRVSALSYATNERVDLLNQKMLSSYPVGYMSSPPLIGSVNPPLLPGTVPLFPGTVSTPIQFPEWQPFSEEEVAKRKTGYGIVWSYIQKYMPDADFTKAEIQAGRHYNSPENLDTRMVGNTLVSTDEKTSFRRLQGTNRSGSPERRENYRSDCL